MPERRRQYYTDTKLQGYLIAALISLQVVLVSVLLIFLYGDIYALIEQQIYRIHSRETGSWPEIFSLLATTMSIFLLLNVVILYLAHALWSRYIKNIIRQFSTVLDCIIGEDFSSPVDAGKSRHPVLDLVRQWFDLEHRRNQEIRSVLENLSRYRNSDLGPDEAEEIKNMLQQYRQLLQAG